MQDVFWNGFADEIEKLANILTGAKVAKGAFAEGLRLPKAVPIGVSFRVPLKSPFTAPAHRPVDGARNIRRLGRNQTKADEQATRSVSATGIQEPAAMLDEVTLKPGWERHAGQGDEANFLRVRNKWG